MAEMDADMAAAERQRREARRQKILSRAGERINRILDASHKTQMPVIDGMPLTLRQLYDKHEDSAEPEYAGAAYDANNGRVHSRSNKATINGAVTPCDHDMPSMLADGPSEDDKSKDPVDLDDLITTGKKKKAKFPDFEHTVWYKQRRIQVCILVGLVWRCFLHTSCMNLWDAKVREVFGEAPAFLADLILADNGGIIKTLLLPFVFIQFIFEIPFTFADYDSLPTHSHIVNILLSFGFSQRTVVIVGWSVDFGRRTLNDLVCLLVSFLITHMLMVALL